MSKRLNGKSLFFIAVLVFVFCVSSASEVYAAARRPIPGTPYGLAVSNNWLTDQVGRMILEAGGNAIDAAAAMGFTLAVVHSGAGNIGGGGFAVINIASGQDAGTYALDYREMSPGAATWDMFIDTARAGYDPDDPSTFRARTYVNPITGNTAQASLYGPLSTGVPGSVAGLCEMVRRFGTMPLRDIMEPAIKLAGNGYKLWSGINLTNVNYTQFDGTRKYFTKNGAAYQTGEIFVQKDLAQTLKRIARDGPDGFYKGITANMIVAEMQKYGGIITHEDLANYKPVWREPVRGTYRGFNIVSMCPPSSGGTHLIQILNTIENEDIGALGFNSVRTIWLMANAMRYAFRDRGEYMADPDKAPVVLNYVSQLTSKVYGKTIYDKIIALGQVAAPVNPDPGFGPFNEGYVPNDGDSTTHYSVVDKWGNAVGITTTINMTYGSRLCVDGAGFFLNDEMDDLTGVPGQPNGFGVIQGWVNVPAPGKRPLSAMTPTIVTRADGSVFMVTGSPGGTRIITHTLHSIVNAIDHGMNVSQAISAPRFHTQWPPSTTTPPVNNLERETFAESRWPSDTDEKLKAMGFIPVGPGSAGDLSSLMIGTKFTTAASGDANFVVTGMNDPRTFYPPDGFTFDELMEYVESRP
ncbi:MAG: gamma-glutamyltransferase [Synergistaceae bacterium]|nr:gamma-glutamyltransferase [Synergistaceae bacterium]